MRESVQVYRGVVDNRPVWSFTMPSNDAKVFTIVVPEGFYLGRDDLGRIAIFRTGSSRPVDLRDATMADRRARLKIIDSKGHVLIDAGGSI